MTDEDRLALVVEFKIWLVRALEEYILRELGAAAKAQGRRLPMVTKNLLRTGATAAVLSLAPDGLGRFARGQTWEESLRLAIDGGEWNELVEDAIRHSFMPSAA